MAFSVPLRRLSSQNHRHLRGRAATNAHFFSHHHRFSSLSSVQTTSSAPSSDPPKPSSLSARMSFVFDQIDAIKKEQSQKDETLQRIRAWRESKMNKETSESLPTPAPCDNQTQSKISTDSVPNFGKLESVGELEFRKEEDKGGGLLSKEVEFVHPWPEWIALMERLVQQNYFDHMRMDEDRMVKAAGFDMSEVAEEGFDFTRDWKTVQTAVLNFGRDRFDILKSLSRQDIQILVGYGCPSSDNKVVFAAKLLRKHAHLDEGDVCSSCSLRSSCERAYLLTNKEDEARTIDVVRVLLTYGFDPLNGSVINKSVLKIKSVKTVVRKLLHMLVKLSAVPIDPNLPPPVIKKPPPKVKQPPPPPKNRIGRDDIEMKKGDWLCTKCDFMNFAKNVVCLQCDAKRPTRQLLPGEWECPECNFLNYRRNVACFHCECKRPRVDSAENQVLERSRGPKSRMENILKRPDVSNAWNFDFDDNESDGADVAAFEYADSHKLDEYFPLDGQAQDTNLQEDDFYKNSRRPKMHEREHSDHGPEQPGMGFDDFDDEEDDVDSYELDTQNNKPLSKTSVAFSELETDSESEHIEDMNDRWQAGHRRNSPTPSKSFKRTCQKATLSDSEGDVVDIDSDDDLRVHSKWKSSHVADCRQRNNRGRGRYNLLDDQHSFDFGSEDMDDEDFGSRKNKVYTRHSSQKDSRRGSCSSRDKPFSVLDSDDEDLNFRKDGIKQNKVGQNRRNSSRDTFRVYENLQFRSNGMIGEKKNKFKADLDRPSQDPYRNDRGSQGDDHGRRKREGFSNQQRERWDNSCFRSDIGSHFEDEERNTRPRVNVR